MHSGIFGYINYLVEKDRGTILKVLVDGKHLCPAPVLYRNLMCEGLSRLEYRGYDSAGLAIDGDKKHEVFAYKVGRRI